MARRKLKSPKAIANELDRFAQRHYRERLQSRLGELRELVRAVRRDEKQAIAQVKAHCRSSRARVRGWYRSRRARLLEQLRAEAKTRLEAAKGACSKRVGNVKRRAARLKAEHQKEAERIIQELAGERMYRELHTGKGKRRSSKREQRQESDDEVRQNLDPELVPVFNAMRNSIKGNARISRTEAFLQWAEENPGDVLAIRAELGDRAFHRELGEHLEKQKAIGKLLKKKKIRPEDLERFGVTADELKKAQAELADEWDSSSAHDARELLERPSRQAVEVDEEVPF